MMVFHIPSLPLAVAHMKGGTWRKRKINECIKMFSKVFRDQIAAIVNQRCACIPFPCLLVLRRAFPRRNCGLHQSIYYGARRRPASAPLRMPGSCRTPVGRVLADYSGRQWRYFAGLLSIEENHPRVLENPRCRVLHRQQDLHKQGSRRRCVDVLWFVIATCAWPRDQFMRVAGLHT